MLAIPACVAIALLNRVLWGSMLQSGYGSLSDLFSLSNIWPNLLLYPRVVATLIHVALLAPIVVFTYRDAGGSVNGDRVTIVALSAWIAVVVAVYLPFPPFDSAWNLRSLLPAITPLLLMATVAARSLAGTRVERHTVAGVIVLAIVCGYGVHIARKSGAFATEYLQRFSAIGEYMTGSFLRTPCCWRWLTAAARRTIPEGRRCVTTCSRRRGSIASWTCCGNAGTCLTSSSTPPSAPTFRPTIAEAAHWQRSTGRRS